MFLFYHNVLHLSSAFSNKFQIFHPFFLLYLFFFRFSGANLPFSPFKQMRKSGLSRNYFSLLLINIKYHYSNLNFFSLIMSCIVVLPVLWVCLVAFFRMFSCAFWKSEYIVLSPCENFSCPQNLLILCGRIHKYPCTSDFSKCC